MGGILMLMYFFVVCKARFICKKVHTNKTQAFNFGSEIHRKLLARTYKHTQTCVYVCKCTTSHTVTTYTLCLFPQTTHTFFRRQQAHSPTHIATHLPCQSGAGRGGSAKGGRKEGAARERANKNEGKRGEERDGEIWKKGGRKR